MAETSSLKGMCIVFFNHTQFSRSRYGILKGVYIWRGVTAARTEQLICQGPDCLNVAFLKFPSTSVLSIVVSCLVEGRKYFLQMAGSQRTSGLT